MRGPHPSADTAASVTVTTPISVLLLPWKMIVIQGLEIDFPYSYFQRTYHVLYHKCSSIFVHYACPQSIPILHTPQTSAWSCIVFSHSSGVTSTLAFSCLLPLVQNVCPVFLSLTSHLSLSLLCPRSVVPCFWRRAFSLVSSLLTKSISSWLANLSCVM